MQQDEEYARLEKQVEREKYLRTELEKWKSCYEEKQDQLRRLGNARRRLQKEIEQFEKRSLRSFAYSLVLQRKKTLSKKRGEEAVLAAQCEDAEKQQAEPEEKIRFYEDELLKLKGAKRRLAQIDMEKISILKEAARAKDAEFAQIEAEIEDLQEEIGQLLKIQQAVQSAYALTQEILTRMDKASQAGRLDLYEGSLFTGLEKHKQLNTAQNLFECLKEQVSQFTGEFPGICVPSDLQISVDGFLKFSDLFLDNWISDSLVLSRIKKAYYPMKDFQRQLEKALQTIQSQRTAKEEERARMEGRLLQKLPADASQSFRRIEGR